MPITVKYSCPLGCITQRTVDVPTREGENVVEWLEGVCMPAVAKDHRSASPFCRATSVKDLYIPMGGTDKVGGPVKQ